MNQSSSSDFNTWTTNNRERLDSYIKPENYQNEDLKVKVYNDDEFVPLKVYRVPTKILTYNFDNVRISGDKAKIEYDRKSPLNPTKKEDQEIVEDILYESKFYSKTATEDLENDIKSHGQEEPSIVSIDGVVLNGNRRLAIRNKLWKTKGEQKYEYVNIVRLPELSLKELKKLERRLQMRKDWKQPYGSIQTRLDVRHSLEDGTWTMEELVASYGGRYTEDELLKFKKEIDLIDDYLVRIKRPKDYIFIESAEKGAGVEIFTALLNTLQKEEKKKTSPLEIEKIKLAGFRIKHHPTSTYEDVRNFGRILSNPQSRSEFIANSSTVKEFNQITKSGNEFDNESLGKELQNLEASIDVLNDLGKDAKSLADKALRTLTEIKDEKIPKNNADFKQILDDLQKRISYLKSKS